MLIAEEEKIIVEERKGNQLVVEEKTLVDTVYALKDQVADILDQMKVRYDALSKSVTRCMVFTSNFATFLSFFIDQLTGFEIDSGAWAQGAEEDGDDHSEDSEKWRARYVLFLH